MILDMAEDNSIENIMDLKEYFKEDYVTDYMGSRGSQYAIMLDLNTGGLTVNTIKMYDYGDYDGDYFYRFHITHDGIFFFDKQKAKLFVQYLEKFI